MDDGAIDWRVAARTKAYAMPLQDIDPVDSEVFRSGASSFANGYSRFPVRIPF